MKFKSARGWDGGATLQDAILSSYAPDGGMYVPEYLPPLTVEALRAWHALDFPLLAAEVLHLFMYADISKAELQQICVDAFKSFDAPEVLPVVRVDRFMVLELMHGPTLAFKDVGQQILGRLIDLFLRRQNATATVVVETSGDTGPAAIAGVQGLQNVQVFCLYPRGRVSPLQEKQMTTCDAANVHVYCTGSNSDDNCAMVKTLYTDQRFVKRHRLCSMNSVNIGRLMCQVTYYVWAYLRVVPRAEIGAEEVTFVVPTGGFGNCVAAYWARCMGLPVARVVAATNANDVVHRTISAGDFRQDRNVPTVTPAMDVQLAYNLERLLYYCSHQNTALVKGVMERVEARPREGVRLDPLLVRQIQAVFTSLAVSDMETIDTMRRVFTEHRYTLCPHSAIGYSAADQLHRPAPGPGPRVVVLAVAHPAKFEAQVVQATGAPPVFPPRAARLAALPERAEPLEYTPEFMRVWAQRLRRDIEAASGPRRPRMSGPWLCVAAAAAVVCAAWALRR